MRRSLRKRTTVENYNESPLIPVDTGVLDADALLETGEPLGPVGPSIQAVEALEAYRELLLKAKAGKGISQFSAQILKIGVEHSCATLGLQQPCQISQESFSNGQAIDIALESLGETIKAGAQKLWEMIKAIFKRIKEFFFGAEAKAEKIAETIEDLHRQFDNLKDKGDVEIQISVKDPSLLCVNGVPFFNPTDGEHGKRMLGALGDYLNSPARIFARWLSVIVSNSRHEIVKGELVDKFLDVVEEGKSTFEHGTAYGNKRPQVAYNDVSKDIDAVVDSLNVVLVDIKPSAQPVKSLKINKSDLRAFFTNIDDDISYIKRHYRGFNNSVDRQLEKCEGFKSKAGDDPWFGTLIKYVAIITHKEELYAKAAHEYVLTLLTARVKFISYLMNQYTNA